MTVPADDRAVLAPPPLLAGAAHLLRHGLPYSPGADARRARTRSLDDDGVPVGWDGTYEYQSTKGLDQCHARRHPRRHDPGADAAPRALHAEHGHALPTGER